MNIDLDKHDLLRNAVPGYVFLIVVMSFYGITGKLDTIGEVPKAIVAIVSGFPLGFIINVIYRGVFHVGSCEQSTMEGEDAAIIRRLFSHEMVKKFEESYGSENKDKKLSHVLLYFLSKNKNHGFRERIYYLVSYVHALGASSLGIFMALIFMLWIKLPLWGKIDWSNIRGADRDTSILVAIWFVIAAVFYFARRPVKVSYRISREVFCRFLPERFRNLATSSS